jgi:phospholipid/cholesterol/gamma-HCH transport system substrate-binding protein
MKHTLETRLGMFVAAAIIAAVLILEVVGGLEVFRPTFPVKAIFKNVHDLKKGDPVKMGGVEVGKVKDISLTNQMVLVSMDIRANQKDAIRTDSKAIIKFAGLMGANYVSIEFGKGAPISAGATLESVEQPDLNAIMGKLDSATGGISNIVSVFSGDKIDNILGPMTDFLKQNQKPLTLMIGNLRAVSEDIATGKGTVGKLIKEPVLYEKALSIVTNLEATSEDVRSVMGDARQVVSSAHTAISNANTMITNINATITFVNAGEGTVGRLVRKDELYTDLKEASANLKEILQKINRGQGSVGKLVNDESLFKNAKVTMQKLDKATEGLEDQGPLSVLGIAINSLF